MHLLQRDERPVHEVKNAAEFHSALEQAESVSGTRRKVQVVIQVSGETGGWHDAVVFWEGYYSPDMPMPNKQVITAVGLKFKARRAKAVVRSTI